MVKKKLYNIGIQETINEQWQIYKEQYKEWLTNKKKQ